MTFLVEPINIQLILDGPGCGDCGAKKDGGPCECEGGWAW